MTIASKVFIEGRRAPGSPTPQAVRL